MPRIRCAWRPAATAELASLIPPALPRLPVGTWALTTHGPRIVAASSAPRTVLTMKLRGVGMPALVMIGFAVG